MTKPAKLFSARPGPQPCYSSTGDTTLLPPLFLCAEQMTSRVMWSTNGVFECCRLELRAWMWW